MSKPVLTSISSLVLIAVFLGITSLHQGCSKKNKEQPMTASQADESLKEVAQKFSEEEYFEDEGAEEKGSQDNESSGQTVSPQTGGDQIGAEPQEVAASRESNYSPTGRYMIIAGNYLLKSNAESMERKLRSQGYRDAQIVVFDLSQYYTVIAGRYNSHGVADRESEKIKSMGIDNYVMTKR